MTKVSVISATYNAARYLDYSFPSVLRQEGAGSAFDLEVIAVDDCSTDNTVELLQKLGITVYRNEQNSGGPNRGRNRALKEASGDFICFFDQDDEWKPDKILRQLALTDRAPIVTNGVELRNANSGQISTIGCEKTELTYFPANRTFLDKLQRINRSQCTDMSSIMIHRDLKDILFEEVHGMLDYDWTLRLFEGRDSIQINRALVVRHVKGPNLSLNKRYRVTDYEFALKVLVEYEARYPAECEVARKRFSGTRARFHYEIGEMSEARRFFMKSGLSLKTCFYIITSYVGSDWVKRRFRVFS